VILPTPPDDTLAVFATLVVRELSGDVQIIARANETGNARKLYRAGADYVLALSTVSGRMLASTILNEDVISFDQWVEVVRVPAGRLAGQSLEDADVRARTSCTVIAVERGTRCSPTSPRRSLSSAGTRSSSPAPTAGSTSSPPSLARESARQLAAIGGFVHPNSPSASAALLYRRPVTVMGQGLVFRDEFVLDDRTQETVFGYRGLSPTGVPAGRARRSPSSLVPSGPSAKYRCRPVRNDASVRRRGLCRPGRFVRGGELATGRAASPRSNRNLVAVGGPIEPRGVTRKAEETDGVGRRSVTQVGSEDVRAAVSRATARTFGGGTLGRALELGDRTPRSGGVPPRRP